MTQPKIRDYFAVVHQELKWLPWSDIRPAAALIFGFGLWLTPILGKADHAYRFLGAGSGLALTLVADRSYSKRADKEAKEKRREEVIEAAQEDVIEAIAESAATVDVLKFDNEAYQQLPPWMRPKHLLESQDDGQNEEAVADPFEMLLKEGIENTKTELSGGQVPSQVVSFDELDLAIEAARNDKSLLISGISGVGKTTLLRHLIHAIDSVHNGAEMFMGIDFKGSTGHFCGLENSGSFVVSPAPGRDYQFAAAQIADVVDMLGDRTEDFPLYLLVDEINNGIEQAKSQALGKMQRKHEDILKSNLKFIATQGRERLIRGIFTAHGNLMGLLGVDGDTAQSLVCAILGRQLEQGDGFSLIRKVLKNQVLFSKEDRSKLSIQLGRVREIVEPTGQAIALTNLRGDWEFVILPKSYKNDPGMLNAEPQNQSVTQLIRDGEPSSKSAKRQFNQQQERFLKYLAKRSPHNGDWFNTRTLADNWGRDNCGTTQQFKEFLASLISCGAIHSKDAELNWFAIDTELLDEYGNTQQ